MNKQELQFIGFFLGEGYCGIVKYKRKKTILYRPQMSITQRVDNKKTVEWIKDFLGGNVYNGMKREKFDGYTSQASIVWITTNIMTIKHITDFLLKSDIPSTKLESIKVVNKFCGWKEKRGLKKHYSKEDIIFIEHLRQSCKNFNQFNGRR